MENYNTTTYDYQTVIINKKNKELVQDCYENLGWEKTSSSSKTMDFKRDRKIKNRKELKVIEREVNNSINELNELEASKERGAKITSLTLGTSSSLVLGGGMAMVLELDLLVPGIILGIIGILLCLGIYPLYAKMVQAKIKKVIPLIETQYDKIAELCDEAVKLQN